MEKYFIYDTEYREFHSFISKEQILEFLKDAANETTLHQLKIIKGVELQTILSIDLKDKE